MMYGLANSVKILEISLETAELVELGSFLTLEIWRSSLLGLKNQSVSSRTNQCLGCTRHVVEFHLEHWEVSSVLWM